MMTISHPRVGPIADATRDDPVALAADFAWTLRQLSKADRDAQRRQGALDALAEYERAGDDINVLEDFVDSSGREALERYCAPYMGFHEIEGRFGFWPDLPMLEEDARSRSGVVKVAAGDPWPPLWPPHGTDIHFVVEVNDHGNVTLFNRRRQEIWSCV
jgi:hypothetical protein